MEVCIIGWYGTETIGDRAILDGIINIYYSMGSILHVHLGSLYPFFTERTLYEDSYKTIYSGINIDTFDIYDDKKTKHIVNCSDHVIMGGGPLMDLDEMYLLLRTFEYAKKIHKTTCLVGCGYGPLRKTEYIRVADELIKCSDIVIFRDSESISEYQKNGKESVKCKFLEDPAIISALKYKEKFENKETKGTAVVNFRDYPSDYYGEGSFGIDKAIRVINDLLNQTDYDITLMPMHTFFIGGDDRVFLNEVLNATDSNRVQTPSRPLSLFETYSLISNASICVGMRYHSVVLQTILNGNNYIINYTKKNTGKISAFVKSIDNSDFYYNRIYHINDKINYPFFSFTDETFIHSWISSDSIVKKYRKELGIKDE